MQKADFCREIILDKYRSLLTRLIQKLNHFFPDQNVSGQPL